jgi:hypothetical protein
VLRVFSRGRCLDDGAAQAAWEADRHAIDFGASLFEDIERLGHIPKFDTDLLENRIGIVFDDLQPLFVEYFEAGDLALYIG